MSFFKIIRKDEQEVSSWSGGTTTQLYIYPEGALYSERDFMFRLSSATVDVEESVFTKLPGIDRKIMILEGELKLIHENRYEKYLRQFDMDSFKGDWVTRSFGKVVDFNLMTSDECSSDVERVRVSSGCSKEIGGLDVKYKFNKVANVLYCLGESVYVEFGEIDRLSKGDVAVIVRDVYEQEGIKVLNEGARNVYIISSSIYFRI